MGDTSNIGVNNTGIQDGNNNVSTPVQPVENNTAPVATSEPVLNALNPETNTSLNIEDRIASSNVVTSEQKPTSEGVKKEENPEDENEINKAPIFMIAILIGLLIILIVYYFVIMTPKHILTTAMDGAMESLESFKDNINSTDGLNIDYNLELETDSNQFKLARLKNITSLNGDKVSGNIGFDLEKGKYLINFIVEKSNTEENKESFKYKDKNSFVMMDASIYGIKDYTYVYPKYYYNDTDSTPPFSNSEYTRYVNGSKNDYDEKVKLIDEVDSKLDSNSITTEEANKKIEEINSSGEEGKIIQANVLDMYGKNYLSNITKTKIDNMYNFIKYVSDNIKIGIEDEQLHRSIVFKKINQDGRETTAVALRVDLNFDKKQIDTLYKNIIKDINNGTSNESKKAIDQLSSITGLSNSKIIENLKELAKEDTKIDSINVSLYMNLANTELIALDVKIVNKESISKDETIDKTYEIELTSLNGIYTIDVTKDNSNHKEVLIHATYNVENSTVLGYSYVDNSDTYLAVDFNYQSSDNSLVLELYSDPDYKEEGKSFAKVNSKLVFEQGDVNEELTKFKENNSWAMPVVIKDEVAQENDITLSLVNSILGDTKLKIEDIVKTENSAIKKKLNVFEGTDFIKVQMGILGHIDFVFDHLARTKLKDYKIEEGVMPLKPKDDSEHEVTIEKGKTITVPTKEETTEIIIEDSDVKTIEVDIE